MNPKRRSFVSRLASLVTWCTAIYAAPAFAAGSGTDADLVPPHAEQKFRGKVWTPCTKFNLTDFPKPVATPAGALNILLILQKSIGVWLCGASAGGRPSPSLRGFARGGVFFNWFHTTVARSPIWAAPFNRGCDEGTARVGELAAHG